MAAVLALYAVSRFCPAEADRRGLALNAGLVGCVTEVVGLTPMTPEILDGRYSTGCPDPARSWGVAGTPVGERAAMGTGTGISSPELLAEPPTADTGGPRLD